MKSNNWKNLNQKSYFDFNKTVSVSCNWGDFERFIVARALSACGKECFDLDSVEPIDDFSIEGKKKWTFRVSFRPQNSEYAPSSLDRIRDSIAFWSERWPACS